MPASRASRPGLDLNDLLRYVMEQRASDLHIKVGSAPFVRIDGHLQSTPFEVVNGADTERMAFAIMPKERADEFMTHSVADFAHSVSGVGRVLVIALRRRASLGLVVRSVIHAATS